MPNPQNPPNGPDRRTLGKSLGLTIVLGAVLVCAIAVWVYIHRPQTDDATMRANFIGVAPHASGHIVQLLVKDNQLVHEGDLLFVIDPRPYEHAVARAKATLVLTRKEVDSLEKNLKVSDASIARAKAQVSASTADIERADAQSLAAEAALQRAEGEFKETDDHFNRLEPLLAKELTTADLVEAARTRRIVAQTGVSQAQKGLSAAKATPGSLPCLTRPKILPRGSSRRMVSVCRRISLLAWSTN
jgi:multidrug efflux system membrane fusion protein